MFWKLLWKFWYIQRVHSWKFYTLTINISEVWLRQIFLYIIIFAVRLENVLNTNLMIRLENVLKMSWRPFCKTSWRRLRKTSWKRLEDVLKTFWNIFVLIKISWRCYEDVFWRRKHKTSSRRVDQDEYLLRLISYHKLHINILRFLNIYNSCLVFRVEIFLNVLKKRKDSLEGSLDRVLFAAELEFLMILVPSLLQHTSCVNTECAEKSEWSK